MPPLILQPFVENAIWHGLMLSKNEKILKIKLYKENEITKLSIIDNGIGRESSLKQQNRKSYKKESVGLKMTDERISLFNQKQNVAYSFKFVDLKDNENNALGTEVQFTFN